MHSFKLNLFGKEEKTLYAFTLLGKLVYLGATFMFITYAFYLFDEMMSHSKDDYKSLKTANTMIAGDDEDAISSSHGHNHREIDSRNKTAHITRNNEFFLNDLNFMPVYEIKSLKQPEEGAFDIFLDEHGGSDKHTGNSWDTSLSLDYKKL